MAEKQVVAATLSVETGNSNANIKEVNKNLNEVKENLSSTGATATKTGKDIDVSTGSFGKLKDQMSALPGPLGQAGDGVNKLSGTFKVLLANPVVLVLTAIVAVLALVYKAFTNTFEGGQKMEQVFAGIKASGQALIDNLENLGGAIVKVFKFDFSGAIKQIRGVAAEAGAAFTAMSKLTKDAQNLSREQATNDLDQAKRAAALAKLREQATDEDIPLAKRKAALAELQKAAQEDAKSDLELAKKVAENKIAQLSLEKDGAKKNFIEIQKLRMDQVNGETESANELRRINKQIIGAEKQEDAERKAIHTEQVERIKNLTAAQKEAEKERIAISERGIMDARKQRDEDLKNADAQRKDQEKQNEITAFVESTKVTIRETSNAALIATTQLTSDQVVQITQNEADRKKLISEIEAEHRQYVINQIANGLGTISEIVGKQTAVGKAFAIAQTAINTYQAGFAAFKGMVTTIPGPVGIALGVVAAAGALASGIAAVKKIAAVQTPGGGGGGGSIGTIPLPSAPIAPQASTTRLDQTSLNQVGNATVRAYVLDSDATTNRERNERLNRAARLA